MPFLSPHYYLSMSGTLFGSESWSIGLRCGTAHEFGGDQVEQDQVDGLAAIVGAWFAGQSIIGNRATLDLLKYNAIGLDGKYALDTTYLHQYAVPVAGSAGSNYPPQVAMVVTLETGFTRGLAHRGRVFLPAPTNATNADGRASETTAQGTADQFADLLNQINEYNSALQQVMVHSEARNGAERLVTGVSVGRVLDTMRSRRTSLDEERVSAALAAGT